MPLPPPELPRRPIALFLDFDGTLVDIAARPDLVIFSDEDRRLLECLHGRLQGALAIVSGREIADLDARIAPARLPTAGIHGMIRRNGDREQIHPAADESALRAVRQHVAAFAERHDGLILETKPGAFALHYRNRPDLEQACRDTIAAALADNDLMRAMEGKMVIEVKPAAVDKGQAVAGFMAEAPFQGRLPIYAGDDTTDEAAFREVNARGGLSIKVGHGDTEAQTRLDSPAALKRWLVTLARESEEAQSQ